jgi:hypothetical protein
MFHKFLRSLSEEKSATAIMLDNLQKLLGLIAMVVGAIWVVKEFYAFQRSNQEWTLRQQELTAQQTELSNKQAALTLQQADVVKEQMNLTLETSKLEINSKKLSIESATRNITAAKDTRYSFILSNHFLSLSNYDDGTHLYSVTVGVDFKNTYDQTLYVKGCLFNTFFAHQPLSGISAYETEGTVEEGRISGPSSPLEERRWDRNPGR